MEKQIITTTDGSNSIFLPEMDEHYHSTHGAIAESDHIYVNSGLLEAAKNKNELKVFEVGFGTGLNVLTTLKAAQTKHLEVEMHSMEAFPLEWTGVKELNFVSLLEMEADVFKKIHHCDWNQLIELSPNFRLKKIHEKLQNFDFQEAIFDVIYFDAFAPEKQADMWTEDIFKKLFEALKLNGILITYCVKGEIRRRLQKVGFRVEKLKGPEGGKREIMKAVKQN